jgi:solute carrier family 35 protein E2
MATSQQIRHRHHQGQGGGEGSHKNNGHYNHSNNNHHHHSTMTSTDDRNNLKGESDEFYDEAATVTSNESTDRHNNQNLTSRLHHHKKSSAAAAAAITHNNMDEEHGLNKSYKSKSSFDKSSSHNSAGGKNNKRRNHLKIDTVEGNNRDSENNPLLLSNDNNVSPTKKTDDIRSKKLFIKTAFWITCWYGTSLATLFLNKIILSRDGSSVHILGMCQMTTAAVLGGWSAYGGLDWGKRVLMRLRNGVVRLRYGRDGGGGGGGEENSVLQSLQSQTQQQQNSSSSTTSTNSTTNLHFARDMSIVGLLRGITVVLGLIALEHVPVSFVETIKATAPAFTVIFAKLILKEHTPSPVMLTLIPVVAGLILCSKSELRFDTIGFLAAVTNNCADCVQNVMSKRMLTHLHPTQLQFYTSVAALLLQSPWVLHDVADMIRSWSSGVESESGGVGNDDEALYAAMQNGGDHHHHLLHPIHNNNNNEMSLGKLLLIDAIFYHLQSVSAYCTMGCMSPVSQSVANTLKRALLVWASILYFHNPVTNSGIVGIIMVVSGVFLYNHVRRIHQS